MAHATFGEIHALETRHGPAVRLPEHEHEDASINIAVVGHFEEVIGSRRVDNRPGTVVAKPCSTGHANRYGAVETGSLLLQVPAKSLDGLGGLAEAFTRQIVLHSTGFRDLALGAIRYLRRADAVDTAEAAVFDLVYRVAHADREPKQPPREWLVRVRDALAERATGPVRVGALACAEGSSPSALSQAFRAAFGVTPLAFVRRRRVEWARAALRQDPHQSLARLAISAGFADQSHLTRAFRVETGLTPGRYRSHLLSRRSTPRDPRS
jgi:AraC family transcriptional regulator